MSVENVGLPMDFHEDGIPIFKRSDLVRPQIPMDGGYIYEHLTLPEHRHFHPEIRFNYILIPPAEGDSPNHINLGKSYPDPKRGYYFGRIIQALESNCRVILQRWEQPGVVTDFLLLTMQPLQLAVIPPSYESIVLNVSNEKPARFFELRAKEESRNRDTIAELSGPGYILKNNGALLPNSNYDELPIPRIHPGHDAFRFLERRPLYMMFSSFPRGFDFIDPPREEFFIGAV